MSPIRNRLFPAPVAPTTRPLATRIEGSTESALPESVVPIGIEEEPARLWSVEAITA